ncbi:helix-turn-helix transcriptional regulator [Sphingobacterium faecale]|uniref:Helix-turn-helix transcriptional regulator n=1 Tax=Sphingobacterium faecale TaxID=2803775 RepID=A0ABS1R0P0_9SPHI|nr:helix-turn-helix transcriptional regulator [Sphingobacterium faecale]MBL1408134.1 helix-turn-helix transcriptional regulator [Sphingobacterium faecale]
MTILEVLRPCLREGNCYSAASAIDNLYFRFLQEHGSTCVAAGLHAVYNTLAALKCIEIKGNLEQSEPFELIQEREGLWLVFQHLGKSILNDGRVHHLESATYLGVTCQDSNTILQLDRGKNWLTVIGIDGGRLSDLREEYTNIAQLFSIDGSRSLIPRLIGYKQKRIFERIQQLATNAYSLPIAIAYHVNQLVFLFDQELGAVEKNTAHQEVALYYRALTYIKEHFLDAKIPRKEIADELCVHERTLTRAFEQKKVTISEMIQLVRLDKAREWVRHTDRSIGQIAECLHFEDLDRFEDAYHMLYKVYPKEDRDKQSMNKPEM